MSSRENLDSNYNKTVDRVLPGVHYKLSLARPSFYLSVYIIVHCCLIWYFWSPTWYLWHSLLHQFSHRNHTIRLRTDQCLRTPLLFLLLLLPNHPANIHYSQWLVSYMELGGPHVRFELCKFKAAAIQFYDLLSLGFSIFWDLICIGSCRYGCRMCFLNLLAYQSHIPRETLGTCMYNHHVDDNKWMKDAIET